MLKQCFRQGSQRSPFVCSAHKLLPGNQYCRWNSTATTNETGAKKQTKLNQNKNYIILGAKSSKLLPKRTRPKPTNISKIDPVKVDVLDEQRKQLLVFKSEASPKIVLDSINLMKPLSEIASSRRYNQIRLDLMRSYSVNQLREYVSQNSPNKPGTKRATKNQLCDTILKDIWNLQVSKDIDENSDVIIEKTIQLSKKDLFIILSKNGAIPRSWTKSGARIVILGQESKIVIRSTADTFDWILASLHKTLQNIKTSKISLEGISKVISNVNDIPLSRIQQLSNASLEFNALKDTIYASALSRNFIDHAIRLIVQSTGFKPRVTNTYVYDTNPDNLHDKVYNRIVDEDTMNWNERSNPWSRLQTVRRRKSLIPTSNTIDSIAAQSGNTKQEGESADKKLLSLQSFPSFEYLNSGKSIGNSIPELSSVIAEQLIATMKNKGTSLTKQLPLTFTATFGYILHETEPIKNVKGLLTKANTAFSTNIPDITQKCSGLSLNTPDIADDETTPVGEFHNEEQQPENDLWKQLLDRENNSFIENKTLGLGDDSEIKPKKSKLIDVEDDFVYLAQLKYVPSPITSSQPDFQDLPPIEVWLEIDETGKCALESTRIVAVEEETNSYLSLPDKPADIRFTSSRAKFLDENEPSVQSYLKNSKLDFSGTSSVYVPEFLKVTVDGKPVEYIYQSMLYRRQVDLKYKDHILQLSTIEGGGFEGRRVEATMVLDYTNGMDEFKTRDLESMIDNALEFNESLKS